MEFFFHGKNSAPWRFKAIYDEHSSVSAKKKNCEYFLHRIMLLVEKLKSLLWGPFLLGITLSYSLYRHSQVYSTSLKNILQAVE